MAELIVANTTNVKEMKNGRPMNVQIPEADMPNCSVVKLVAAQKGELDHVFTAQKITTKEALAEAIAADLAYVIVAPEIMVEEARRTDGHIGKFRFKKDAVIASIKEYLQELLVFSDNEKEFVKEFANKNYRPELLFEDKEIVERISAHPMALWRVREN